MRTLAICSSARDRLVPLAERAVRGREVGLDVEIVGARCAIASSSATSFCVSLRDAWIKHEHAARRQVIGLVRGDLLELRLGGRARRRCATARRRARSARRDPTAGA